jgi:hypothetical protein
MENQNRTSEEQRQMEAISPDDGKYYQEKLVPYLSQ